MTLMGSYLCNLLFITVNAPESANIVSVDEAVRILLLSGEGIR